MDGTNKKTVFLVKKNRVRIDRRGLGQDRIAFHRDTNGVGKGDSYRKKTVFTFSLLKDWMSVLPKTKSPFTPRPISCNQESFPFLSFLRRHCLYIYIEREREREREGGRENIDTHEQTQRRLQRERESLKYIYIYT